MPFPKLPTIGMPSSEILGILIGVIISMYWHAGKVWTDYENAGKNIFVYGTYQLTYSDALSMGIAVLLALFGQKIHKMLRYVGIGWIVGYLGAEIIEGVTASGVA